MRDFLARKRKRQETVILSATKTGKAASHCGNSLRHPSLWWKLLANGDAWFWCTHQNNRKGGTASLRSRTCVKRNAVLGARIKGLSLYLLYQRGNLIRVKTGLDTCLIRIQTGTPLSRNPPYDYSKLSPRTRVSLYGNSTETPGPTAISGLWGPHFQGLGGGKKKHGNEKSMVMFGAKFGWTF